MPPDSAAPLTNAAAQCKPPPPALGEEGFRSPPGESAQPLRRLLGRFAAPGEPQSLLAGVCCDVREALGATGVFAVLRDGRAPGGMHFASAGLGAAAATAVRSALLASDGIEPAAGTMRAPIAAGGEDHGAIIAFAARGAQAFDSEDAQLLRDVAATFARLRDGHRLGALPPCPLGYEENRRECIYQAHDLAESELRFRQLAENIREAFFLVQPDMSRVHYVSPAYEEIWGRTRESLYESPWSFADAIHPEDRHRIASMSPNNLRGDWDDEYRVVRPDGTVRWVRSRGFPIRDARGNLHRVAGIAEDVTARREAEDALRASVARNRLLFEGNPLPMWVLDLETLRFLDVNEAACARYGYSREAFRALSAADIRPEEDSERFRQALREARPGQRYFGRWRHRLRDGRLITVEVVAHHVSFEGRRTAFVCPIDVTERLEAEARLRESERRFAEMLGRAQQIAIMLDTEGRLTYCNDFFLDLTGWAREEVIGRPWAEMFVPPELEGLTAAFADLLAGSPAAWHRESEIVTRSGDRRMVEWNNSLLRSPAGDVIGCASLGVDVTERRRAAEDVRRLNEDLERRVAERTAELKAANEELQAFDYSVAHDLRAPLARVRGFADALANDETIAVSERGRDFAGRIARAAARMDDLVGDLLRLSLVSREKLRREKVDLRRVALEAFESLRRAHQGRSVQLVLPERLEATGDAKLLRIVLDNLIGNAWKFTSRRDDAWIELGRDGSAIYVRDNGAGFDPSRAGRLFTPFQRLHDEREFEGTGIGLAIVQRIVHRHGGEVVAEGAVGAGATFRLTLPD